MVHASPAILSKAHGRELVDWLARSDDEERELIVEAVVPARTVTLKRRGTRVLPAAVRAGEGSPSNPLERLYADLGRLLHSPPTLLKAARAVAVLANSREARKLLDHPLVKAVRLNRSLRPRR